jgi:hypothetical protein
MYRYDFTLLTNREILQEEIGKLKKMNSSESGLPNKIPYSSLLRGVSFYERKALLGYNLNESLKNPIIFTGQCLIKNEEDLKCPITVEDAIECLRLRELKEKTGFKVICMLPDLEYSEPGYTEGMREYGEDINYYKTVVEEITSMYESFRSKLIPGIEIIRTTTFAKQLSEELEKLNYLSHRIARAYHVTNPRPSLQRLVLKYGIDTALLPELLGYSGDIIVFAEPGEICSVKAAELVIQEKNLNKRIALVGQIPLPSLNIHIKRKIRMYSGRREERIHLNENLDEIRRKLTDDPTMALLILYMSPLTEEELLKEILRSTDRSLGIDEALDQIIYFKEFL